MRVEPGQLTTPFGTSDLQVWRLVLVSVLLQMKVELLALQAYLSVLCMSVSLGHGYLESLPTVVMSMSSILQVSVDERKRAPPDSSSSAETSRPNCDPEGSAVQRMLCWICTRRTFAKLDGWENCW